MARIATSSVPKLALMHFILLLACAISTFPIFRVVAISFRNTDTVTSQGHRQFPPRGEASVKDYLQFFTDAIMPTDIVEALKSSGQPRSEVKAPEQAPAAAASDDPFADLDKASEQPTIRHWYSNYTDLFTRHLFLQWIYNSLMIALSASFIGVFLAASAAYAFARFEFPGKRLAEGFMFMT